jgi:hypothetical protein
MPISYFRLINSTESQIRDAQPGFAPVNHERAHCTENVRVINTRAAAGSQYMSLSHGRQPNDGDVPEMLIQSDAER